MSATIHTSDPPPIDAPEETTGLDDDERLRVRPGTGVTRRERPHHRQGPEHSAGTRERRLDELSPAALVAHIARLEASMGGALSLLRRCIVERRAPTREALAAEAGFALGMSREAALAELDEVAQIVGVSSLR